MNEIKSNKVTVEDNSYYVSSSLLDELDYVVGGHGPATVEFLFNFNAFIESYILASHFIVGTHEYEHMNITRKVLFPNGRPILDLLIESQKLYSIQGVGNPLLRCVYVREAKQKSRAIIEESILEFCNKEKDKIISTIAISDIDAPIKSITTFSLGMNETQIMIGESFNSPYDIAQKFFEVTTNSNVQSVLPLFAYKEQIKTIENRTLSKEIYKTLYKLHGQNIDDAEQHLGREVQSLPPFVGIVLSKCKSSDDIPKVLKEIRADFEDFRNCCERFEKQLNAAKTVKEQVDAVKEYKTFWSTLVKKYTDKRSRLMYRFLDIASESEYEKAADSALDNLSTTDILKDLNLGKVAGKTGIAIWDKLKERKILNKFKGVVNLWDLLENSPTIQTQLDDIERIFKTKVDRTKLNRAKTFLKSH